MSVYEVKAYYALTRAAINLKSRILTRVVWLYLEMALGTVPVREFVLSEYGSG